MNRRQFLNRFPVAAGAFALPLRAVHGDAALAGTERFRFAVLNDLHHDSPECDAWFTRLVDSVGAEAPDFCILAGDLANVGLESSLLAVRDHFARLECPVYTVPGNHDCDVEETTRLYSKVFPDRLNYRFRHKGWQFIGLDTTDGKEWQDTRISSQTLEWLDKEVPRLEAELPSVVFTHFPLAAPIHMASLNAGEVWKRLAPLNIRAAFCGHFHGQHTVIFPPLVTTNVCCARVRGNFDGDPRKGFWMVEAGPDGKLAYQLKML
jgi:3',5'-cyclic AMP phosphodiesterase CpdA